MIALATWSESVVTEFFCQRPSPADAEPALDNSNQPFPFFVNSTHRFQERRRSLPLSICQLIPPHANVRCGQHFIESGEGPGDW